MADAQHKLSRRAVLGAALAAPVLSFGEGPVLSAVGGPVPSFAPPRHSGLDPESTFFPSSAAEHENRGMPDQVRHDEERRIDAAWTRALTRYRRAEHALAAAAHTEDESLYDRLGTRHDRALTHLLNTPAPHLEALADKLDLTLAHQAWELTGTETALFTLPADARRLAAVCLTFCLPRPRHPCTSDLR